MPEWRCSELEKRGNFPGSLVVKSPCFHPQGTQAPIPGQGTSALGALEAKRWETLG